MPKSFLIKKGMSPDRNEICRQERSMAELMNSYPLELLSIMSTYHQLGIVEPAHIQAALLNSIKRPSTSGVLDDTREANYQNEPIDYSVPKRQSSQLEESFNPSQDSSTQTTTDIDERISDNKTPVLKQFQYVDGRSKRSKSSVSSSPSSAESSPEKEPRYTCGECGKHYATSSNLSRHKQTHRSMDSNQAKRCPHCDKTYVSMPALSMHILTHKLKHRCDICNKAFSRPWLLQGHMRSHTGERPYRCELCSKKFADRSNLRAHMQTHNQLKEYRCDKCDKTFGLRNYLSKHLESSCQDEQS